MLFRGFIEHTFEFLVKAVLHIINFILCWSINKKKTLFRCHRPPISPPAFPLNVNYFATSLDTVASDPGQYKLFMFQV
jgi:hypothetical protein